MRVAILGAGGIGLCAAALLCQEGHSVALWSPTGNPPGTPLVATGAVTGTFTPDVAATCQDALTGAAAVLLAVPGYGHRAVIEAMAPHLQPGQVVLYSSHMSFGALHLRSLLEARGVACPIVAWGTTVVTGRRVGPAAAHIGNVRARLDAAVLGDPAAWRPAAPYLATASSHAKDCCRSRSATSTRRTTWPSRCAISPAWKRARRGVRTRTSPPPWPG